MGKIVYRCGVKGCKNKKRVHVKHVHGVVWQAFTCPQHSGEAERNEGRKKKRKGLRKSKGSQPVRR